MRGIGVNPQAGAVPARYSRCGNNRCSDRGLPRHRRDSKRRQGVTEERIFQALGADASPRPQESGGQRVGGWKVDSWLARFDSGLSAGTVATRFGVSTGDKSPRRGARVAQQ